jgi:hypothetical protein
MPRMSALSPEEKQALRQKQGLLAGTRQWSMPGLNAPSRRRRGRGALFAAGLILGGLVAIALLTTAIRAGWL